MYVASFVSSTWQVSYRLRGKFRIVYVASFVSSTWQVSYRLRGSFDSECTVLHSLHCVRDSFDKDGFETDALSAGQFRYRSYGSTLDSLCKWDDCTCRISYIVSIVR